MPKRKAVDNEWELHKDEILELYIKKNMRLKDVVEIMACGGFKRTKSQYERILKKWKVSKNLTEEEWKFIFQQLEQRQGKASEVKVRGVEISQRRLQKEKSRYCFQTSFDRYTSRNQRSFQKLRFPPLITALTGTVNEPNTYPLTLPGVEVRTPVNSPTPDGAISEQDTTSSFALPDPDDTVISADDSSRWQYSDPLSPLSALEGCELDPELRYIASPNWIDELLLQIEFELAATSPSSFIHPQMRFIRLCKHLISNELGAARAGVAMLGHLRDEHYLSLFRRVLGLHVPEMIAFAETLLVPAAMDGNTSLIKVLLANENDHDLFGERSSDQARRSTYCSAMRFAFEKGHLQIVELLRDSGARLCRPGSTNPIEIKEWDPLIVAVQSRNEDMIHFALQEIYGIREFTTDEESSQDEQKQNDAVRRLIDLGSSYSQESCRLAIMCIGIDSGANKMVEQALNEMIALSCNTRKDHLAGVLKLAVIHDRQDLVQSLLMAGVSPYDSIELGVPGLKQMYEHCEYFSQRDSAFEAAMDYQRIDIIETFLRFGPVGLSTKQLRNRDRQISAGYAKAMEADFSNISSTLKIAWERLRLSSAETEENRDIEQRLHCAFQEASKAKDHTEVAHIFNISAKQVSTGTREGIDSNHQMSSQHAASCGVLSIFRKFSNAGAKIRTAIGETTLLQAAAIAGDTQIIHILLKSGADVNASPAADNGRTAIEGAAENGHSSAVRYLLMAGADVKGRDNMNYRRTVYRAWKNHHKEIVNIIHAWKTIMGNSGDCVPTDDIMASMTEQDLRFYK